LQFWRSDQFKFDKYETSETEIRVYSFYEAEPGRAHPIRAWFYPGDNYGVEFVYPKTRALEVAKASGQHVMSAANATTTNPSQEPTAAQVTELKNEQVVAATPQGTETSLAEAHPPTTPSASSSVTEVKPGSKATSIEPSKTEPAKIAANTGTPRTKTLPKTAGNLPVFTLAGVILVGAAFSLRVLFVR
jgi:hypothetical protein